jgi:hypothetical protein
MARKQVMINTQNIDISILPSLFLSDRKQLPKAIPNNVWRLSCTIDTKIATKKAPSKGCF